MKNPRMQSKRSAFTLIELLVVISIIAVLASLSFPAITSVMVNARKVQAKNDMSQIASAIKMYYTEYGRYPIDSTTATDDTTAVYGVGEKTNDVVINVLRCVTTGTALNTRQIKFIEPKITTAKKACVNLTDGKWYDPWGMQYVIFIDADYANDIDASAAFTDINPAKPEVSVGVASGGYHYVKNKQAVPAILTKRAFDKSNDLLSWQ